MVFSAGTKPTAALFNAAFDSLLTAEGGYASVATAQTTSSTSYTDLATVGPQVSVTSVGTRALILFAARLRNTSGTAGTGCTVAVSGATTLAAADANGAMWTDFVNAGFDDEKMQFMFATINPGLNTYTMKYRASAGTAQYSVRRMYVFAP